MLNLEKYICMQKCYNVYVVVKNYFYRPEFNLNYNISSELLLRWLICIFGCFLGFQNAGILLRKNGTKSAR